MWDLSDGAPQKGEGDDDAVLLSRSVKKRLSMLLAHAEWACCPCSYLLYILLPKLRYLYSYCLYCPQTFPPEIDLFPILVRAPLSENASAYVPGITDESDFTTK